jgi:hypothetical protein
VKGVDEKGGARDACCIKRAVVEDFSTSQIGVDYESAGQRVIEKASAQKCPNQGRKSSTTALLMSVNS